MILSSSSSSSQQHIRIIRLPLHIFHNLTAIKTISNTNNENIDDDDSSSSKLLRYMIVTKLQHYASSGNSNSNSRTNSSTTGSIITVGYVIHIPILLLLHILDPLLTYSYVRDKYECKEFYKRLCDYCSPTKQTAIELFYNFHVKLKTNTNSILDTTTTGNGQQHVQQQHLPQQQQHTIATGIVPFDQYLHGGIRIGTITEIYGPPGCGKTQLAIQMSILLAMNNTTTSSTTGTTSNTSSYGTIYIDTENKLCIQRMKEICINQIKLQSSSSQQQQQQQFQIQSQNCNTTTPTTTTTTTTTTSSNVLSKISIHTPHTLHDLWYVLLSLEDDLLLGSSALEVAANNTSSVPSSGTSSCIEQNDSNTNLPQSSPSLPIRLIVIDSIAAPMNRLDDANIDNINSKSSSSNSSSLERTTLLLKIAQLLKRYADQFQLAVLIINQVVSSNNDQNNINNNNNNTILDTNDDNINNTANNYGLQQQQQQYVAALGISWHHCVSTRIHVYWMDDYNNDSNNINTNNCENTLVNASVGYSNYHYHHHHHSKQQRLLSIVKSNVVPCTSTTSGNTSNKPIPFIIHANGCVGIGS